MIGNKFKTIINEIVKILYVWRHSTDFVGNISRISTEIFHGILSEIFANHLKSHIIQLDLIKSWFFNLTPILSRIKSSKSFAKSSYVLLSQRKLIMMTVYTWTSRYQMWILHLGNHFAISVKPNLTGLQPNPGFPYVINYFRTATFRNK